MIKEQKQIVPIPCFSILQVLPPASSVALAPTTQSKFRHYAQSNWTSVFFMTCTITNSKSTWCKHCTQRTTYLNLVIVQFLYKMFFRKRVLRRKRTKGTSEVSWYSLNNLSLIQTICILFRWWVLKLPGDFQTGTIQLLSFQETHKMFITHWCKQLGRFFPNPQPSVDSCILLHDVY